ncbi:uncharacterized protein LOC103506659 [Caligus rogercresseyi]|uniref:Uncharacterized protein LOC103506659 n=1 Tax=Caligus rogercresseyi TaxID=217165 RepID=A0A7T8K8X2_CALRO|nr:uncharacterized protein LOC103506659 [Caligus rogercresseyi]
MVLCSPAHCDVTNLTPCSHEEADTRLLLHISDAVQKGLKKVTIRTVDTDVVVLAVALFRRIKPEEMWIAFGGGTSFRHISVHEIANKLDPSTCAAFPLFHALTGCDTVSAFAGRGKKTAWETWKAFPEVTEAFNDILKMEADVNEARQQLFTHKSRTLENMPPTKAGLVQQIKRAAYQANVWCKALEMDPQLPSPSDWGWVKDEVGWQPLWTTLPEASQSCYELIHCVCKKGCTTRCSCKKAALKCTALCLCSGDC